ncbi:hypothetical protein RQP54_12600 [Curvibacter sp. APW13]|uniref:hypothetical protein n=1 Tax=Curvibacter sp. APW13 TaxID=3077236 RepID=UPI0028DE576D|nr:hypothetical protein [Curvibacter sp. APW13]MDT8991702.1 hypothetical protein [Curvibacter sp. APW13]
MKSVWFFGLASLALLLALAAYLAPLQPPLVVLQMTFSPAAFQAVTSQWGPAGVALFRSHLLPDFGLMLCYALYGVCTVRYTRLFQMRHVPPIFWYSIMPLAALADVSENCFHLALTAPGAQPADWWYGAAGASASVKFALIVLFLGAAIWRGFRLRRPR